MPSYHFSLSYKDIVEQIKNIDPKQYAQTRNMLDGAVTRLSPYITRGVISLPYVRDTVLQNYSQKDSYKLIQELAWREYFQKTWVARGDDIFIDLRFAQEPTDNAQMPKNIVDAATGIETIDKCIESLYKDGYMHNHARLTVASLCCNLGQSHWKVPSAWMYYHLLDGDPASNTLSWQWVAGTSISKKYFTDQSLINHWSGTQQSDTFLNFDREQTLKQTKPNELYYLETPTLETVLPRLEQKVDVTKETNILLYHPFHLDPVWHRDKDAVRVLVFEPSWFKKHPVSEKVMKFIIDLAQENIPNIQIFVGEYAELDINPIFQKAITREHPCTEHWTDCEKEPRAWLFPEVTGYYKSFFAFWKECEKYL